MLHWPNSTYLRHSAFRMDLVPTRDADCELLKNWIADEIVML